MEASLPLEFGATPVNESKVGTWSYFLLTSVGCLEEMNYIFGRVCFQVKTFTLKNPSSSVVSVEIRILSLYSAPLEALDLLTKW